MKIFWSSVEYEYRERLDLKGGFVYAFIKATDVRDALNKILSELDFMKLNPLYIEFISPYDVNLQWSSKKETKHYKDLYKKADSLTTCVFDTFYAFEKD